MNTLPLRFVYEHILPFKVIPNFGINKEWDNHEKELLKWKKEVITTDKVNEYAKYGNKDYIKFCTIEYGVDHISRYTVKAGYKYFLRYMINSNCSADDWNDMAYHAALCGHKGILYDMIERGANNWNRIASGAAAGGHKDIVNDMIDRSVIELKEIAYRVSYSGRYELAKEIREKYLK